MDIPPSNTHPVKACVLSIHTEGTHTNMLPVNPPTAGKTNLIVSINLAEGGSTHPTLPFPVMDPDQGDIKPRKGTAARTHVPLLPTITRNWFIAICLLRRLESTAGGKQEEGFNQDNTWKVWKSTKSLIINHCRGKRKKNRAWSPFFFLQRLKVTLNQLIQGYSTHAAECKCTHLEEHLRHTHGNPFLYIINTPFPLQISTCNVGCCFSARCFQQVLQWRDN